MTKWVTKKLGEICWPSPDKYNPLIQKEFKDCIEMENIEQNSGSINGMSDISKLLSIKNKFEKGDVLYGKLRPYLRKYWLAQFNGVCSTEIWVLKHDDSVNSKYLFYLFQTEQINKIANLSSGTKMPRADWPLMQNKYISIPESLAEQRRIAGILSSADGAIAASEALIAKYRNIKRGLLTTLLQPKDGWKKVKLGECLTRLCNGLTYDVEEKSGYMVTRIETISNDDIDYNRVGHIRTLPKQEYRIQKGDILFSHINSVKHIGKVAYFDDEQELYHGMNLLLMRFHESCDSKFFFYMLSSEEVRKRMRSLAKSAVNQASINTTELHNFLISYPEDLAEQRRIAEILSSVDAKIAAEEKVVEKYKGVKKGLMEEMLGSEKD